MLAASGFLWGGTGGGAHLYDEASAFHARCRKEAKAVRPAGWPTW